MFGYKYPLTAEPPRSSSAALLPFPQQIPFIYFWTPGTSTEKHLYILSLYLFNMLYLTGGQFKSDDLVSKESNKHHLMYKKVKVLHKELPEDVRGPTLLSCLIMHAGSWCLKVREVGSVPKVCLDTSVTPPQGLIQEHTDDTEYMLFLAVTSFNGKTIKTITKQIPASVLTTQQLTTGSYPSVTIILTSSTCCCPARSRLNLETSEGEHKPLTGMWSRHLRWTASTE